MEKTKKDEDDEFWNLFVDLDEKIIDEFEEVLNNKKHKHDLENENEAG